MTIVCGIDFSPSSARAADVAAALAVSVRQPLRLVHALAEWPGEVYADEKSSVLAATRRGLEKEAERLRQSGAEVHLEVELGTPEQALARCAAKAPATLVVLGATGLSGAAGKQIGSSADRIVQRVQAPTLLVRDPAPLLAWVQAKRPLKVGVGVDFTRVSEGAWRWTQQLARAAPLEAVGLYVYWPPDEFARLGLGGLRSYVENDPEVDRVLRRELSARYPPRDDLSVRFRVEPTIGNTAERLLQLAAEEQVDLVVVGSHQRRAIARLWEQSVSRGVLHHASGSVVCIPLEKERAVEPRPGVKVALAATDFSPTGDAAIAHAFSQVASGGTVHLIHVVAPHSPRSALQPRDIFAQASEAERQQLLSLVPRDAVHGAVEVHVLEARDAAEAISQAAERLNADVICLGREARAGLKKAALGAVAEGVLARTLRPVLLVRCQPE